jgi:hypothetical protein
MTEANSERADAIPHEVCLGGGGGGDGGGGGIVMALIRVNR